MATFAGTFFVQVSWPQDGFEAEDFSNLLWIKNAFDGDCWLVAGNSKTAALSRGNKILMVQNIREPGRTRHHFRFW